MSADLWGHLLLIGGSFGFGIASALIPIINAEAYVLAVCAAARPWPASIAMVALVLGTLVGKLVLFMGARHRDKLGRWLGRHGDEVNAAEAGMARGVAADVAMEETRLHRATARAKSEHTAEIAVPDAEQDGRPDASAEPPKKRRFRWLPPAPAWLRRFNRAVIDWGDRALSLLDKPWQAAGVLMASASIGIPPLAVTTIAAGLRKTSLPVFIVCVIVGRSIRFGIIAVPTLLARN